MKISDFLSQTALTRGNLVAEKCREICGEKQDLTGAERTEILGRAMSAVVASKTFGKPVVFNSRSAAPIMETLE